MTTYTYVFSNDAKTTLAGAITNIATSLNLQSGAGVLFPNPSSSTTPPQAFVLTLISQVNTNIKEIMLCTGRSGDTLTVVRAQEGTSNVAWNAGDIIQHGPTAAQMAAMQQVATTGSLGPITPTLTSYLYYGLDTGTADNMVVTVNSGLTVYVDGCEFEWSPAYTNLTTTPVVNINGIGSKAVIHTDGSSPIVGELEAGVKMLWAYDAPSGKVVILEHNVATTAHLGVSRIATNTEALNGVTTAPGTATMTPEDVAIYVAGQVATTAARGITRIATNTEALNGVTGGTVPAAMTPEDTAIYLAGQVSSTTARGIIRTATNTEATNGITTGSAPAAITPEQLQAKIIAINMYTDCPVGTVVATTISTAAGASFSSGATLGQEANPSVVGSVVTIGAGIASIGSIPYTKFNNTQIWRCVGAGQMSWFGSSTVGTASVSWQRVQ